MKTITILLLVAILALVTAPVAAADACEKSFLIQLGLAKAGTKVTAVQVVYGSPPLPESGVLTGKVLAADGGVITTFSLPDPRVQFGDVMMVSEDGMNKTALTGTLVTEDYAELVVMFPYSPQAVKFTLHDATGTLLAAVDLATAENKATWDCTAGWGVTPPRSAAAPVTATTAKAAADPLLPAAAIGILTVAVGILARRQG